MKFGEGRLLRLSPSSARRIEFLPNTELIDSVQLKRQVVNLTVRSFGIAEVILVLPRLICGREPCNGEQQADKCRHDQDAIGESR